MIFPNLHRVYSILLSCNYILKSLLCINLLFFRAQLCLSVLVCTVCKKSASKKRNTIACSDCQKMCHGSCVNLTREDIDFMTSQGQVWRCPSCAKLRRKSMSGKKTEEHADIAQVIRMLEEAKTDRKRMEDEMNKAFEFIHQTVKDHQETLKRQDKMLAAYLEKNGKYD